VKKIGLEIRIRNSSKSEHHLQCSRKEQTYCNVCNTTTRKSNGGRIEEAKLWWVRQGNKGDLSPLPLNLTREAESRRPKRLTAFIFRNHVCSRYSIHASIIQFTCHAPRNAATAINCSAHKLKISTSEIIGPPLAAPVCNCHSLILHLLSSASPCSRSNHPTLPCSQHSASKRLAGHSSLAPVAGQCQDRGSHCLHSSLAVACPMT